MFWGLIAAAIPPLFRVLFLSSNKIGQDVASINAFWGGLIAIVVGLLLIRNLGRYPGVERAAAILPSFSVSFGALVVLFLMFRLEYSRLGLLGAYACAIAIFYVGYVQVHGRKRLTIGVLPESIDELRRIDRVNWVVLNHLDDPVDRLDAVAIDLRLEISPEWERRIADFALSDLPVYHAKHLVESLTGRVELEHLSETSFGTLSPNHAYLAVKYLTDRLVAIVLIIALAPIMAIIALLIRWDSPGPAIFKQQRIGFHGAPFTAYKFRTMRHLPSVGDARFNAITRDNDDRITRFGKLLRKTRIDEIPQILNVLLGQMSWIGPRPEATALSEWYETEISFYRYRHIVRPGITGWAQVMQGHVANVDEVRNKLHYDFYYIRNFSLWLDSLITFRTIVTILTGFGAK